MDQELGSLHFASFTWGRFLGSLALAVFIPGLAFSSYAYHAFLMAGFFAFALSGSIVLLFRVRQTWIDVLLVAGIAALLCLVQLDVLHFRPTIMSRLSSVGCASLLILGLRTAWEPDATQRTRLQWAFWPALTFVLTMAMASRMLDFSTTLQITKYDLYLYSFDCSLGLQIPFIVGQWFRHHDFALFCIVIYLALALVLAIVYAAHIEDRRRALRVFAAFVITAPLGTVAYNAMPAMGPIHVFPSFPLPQIATAAVKQLVLEPVMIAGAPNAIPSLHMAWVLLAFWNSRLAAWWIRGIALVFLVFTSLATMGTGEHYFIDLAVAFPFALMVQGVASIRLSSPRRYWVPAVVTGGLMTAGWLVLLQTSVRIMWIVPAIPWALVALTLFASLFVLARLEDAFDQDAVPALEEADVPVISVAHPG